MTVARIHHGCDGRAALSTRYWLLNAKAAPGESFVSGHDFSRSMKGDVKRHFSPWTRQPKLFRHPAPTTVSRAWVASLPLAPDRDGRAKGDRSVRESRVSILRS
jgi:hypothetical protein